MPILMTLELLVEWVDNTPSYNFQVVEWDKFREELARRLLEMPEPGTLDTVSNYENMVSSLTCILQETISVAVPKSRPSPHSKRWWNKELDTLKKKKNKLRSLSYKFRALADHPSHKEHRRIWRDYSSAITKAKQEHWASFLEGLSFTDVWTANRYISGDGSDGGKTRILMLTLQPSNTEEVPTVASANKDKSAMLMSLMFPNRPSDSPMFPGVYEDQLPPPVEITEGQIRRHITNLNPYKVPGIDGIPNIVLKRSADYIIPYLLQIFQAMLKMGVYAGQWKEIMTCVLRKPGKPRYNIPKAYQPVVLVNTIAKLLSSIVAKDIVHLTEAHSLLPANHFGGRPGRTMSDSLHLLVDTVKAAWWCKQVVSTLFLDIEGAFPNAVTDRLLHNLRKQRIPERYVVFVSSMLTGRRNRLKFDDYLSEWFHLDNVIVQGDPLSMILYLYYNADLLDIA